MGPKGRWKRNLINKIKARAAESHNSLHAALRDFSISPKVRQLLQHWAYAVTLEDLEK